MVHRAYYYFNMVHRAYHYFNMVHRVYHYFHGTRVSHRTDTTLSTCRLLPTKGIRLVCQFLQVNRFMDTFTGRPTAAHREQTPIWLALLLRSVLESSRTLFHLMFDYKRRNDPGELQSLSQWIWCQYFNTTERQCDGHTHIQTDGLKVLKVTSGTKYNWLERYTIST